MSNSGVDRSHAHTNQESHVDSGFIQSGTSRRLQVDERRGIRAQRVRDEGSGVGGGVCTRHSGRVHLTNQYYDSIQSLPSPQKGQRERRRRHADGGSGSRLARSRPPSRPRASVLWVPGPKPERTRARRRCGAPEATTRGSRLAELPG